MHRERTQFARRVNRVFTHRADRVAKAVERRGIRATYRLHDHSGARLHHDAEAMLSGADITLARYRETYADHPRLLAKYLAMMSRISLEDGRRWRSARLALEASWHNPRRPHAVRQVVASLLGANGYQAVRRARRRVVTDPGGGDRAGTARCG